MSVEKKYSDKLQSRGCQPRLFVKNGLGWSMFEGKVIPGITIVESRYEQNGKWSGTNWTLSVDEGVEVIECLSPWSGWERMNSMADIRRDWVKTSTMEVDDETLVILLRMIGGRRPGEALDRILPSKGEVLAFIGRHEPTAEQIAEAESKGLRLIAIGDFDGATREGRNAAVVKAMDVGATAVAAAHAGLAVAANRAGMRVFISVNESRPAEDGKFQFKFVRWEEV